MSTAPTLMDLTNLTIAAVALAVAIMSGVYTWRAFTLQHYSTSASGLDFLHVELNEAVSQKAPIGVEMQLVRPFFVSAIISRGPATRYGAQGVVWGRGNLRVLTPVVQVWGPDHPGIEFDLRRGRNGEWEGVYCGVVWEAPKMFWSGFRTEGYRVKLEPPGSTDRNFVAERWNEKKGKWVALKKGTDFEKEALAGSVHQGESLSRKLRGRHPDFDPLTELRSHVAKTQGDADTVGS